MHELKASIDGLLLIFIISTNLVCSIAQEDIHECIPLGKNMCQEDGDCCSYNCFMDHFNQKYGVCRDPKPMHRAVSRECKDLGDNTCIKDEDCCTYNCSADWKKENGVCAESTLFSIDISENPDSTDDIRDRCKHLGNNMCGSDHECCSHYCHKRPVDALFGICRIPKDSRFKNGGDGIYEKVFCTFYGEANLTANGEQYDGNELTAAHQTLPFNIFVRITVMDRHVAVRINDRREPTGVDSLQMSVRAALILGLLNEEPFPCWLTILTDENCTPNFKDTCVMNHECCSRNCHGASGVETGKCVPRSD